MGQCCSRLMEICTCCRRPRQAAPPTPPLRRHHNIRRHRRRRRNDHSPDAIDKVELNVVYYDESGPDTPTPDVCVNGGETNENNAQTEDSQKSKKNASTGKTDEGEIKSTTDAAITTDHRSSGARAAKRAMMLKDGTLSYEEFCFHSRLFASVANKNNDTWIIHGSKEDTGSMYIVKKIAPHELHEPQLCLRGLSFHQQHHNPSHLETIRDIIKTYIDLLNDRVGTPPERSISMIQLSCSQVSPKRILRRRHSFNLKETKKPFESKPPEPFTLHVQRCGSHTLPQNKLNQESSYCLGSKSDALSDRVNSFCSNKFPSNTVSQRLTSDIKVPDCAESDNITDPPTPFCKTVNSLENKSDVNYLLSDDQFNLQEEDTNFYKTLEDMGNVFENELHSITMPSSTQEKLFFSTESSDDLFSSNIKKKLTNAPSGVEPCLYCNSFSREDPAELNVPEKQENELFWEFHVLYSISYCVPVLYFQVWGSDGKVVPLQELWRIVDVTFQGRLNDDKWSILTQQEHPLLRRPFYYLHPCGTESLLKILKPSWNPIVSWLMTVGPSIGLNICPLYGEPRHEPAHQKILKNKKAVH